MPTQKGLSSGTYLQRKLCKQDMCNSTQQCERGPIGPTGFRGPTGPTGAIGADGNHGSTTFDYKFSTHTDALDPGVGYLRYDRSTQNQEEHI